MATLSGKDLEARARRVKLLILDVDGVMTDGTVWQDADGGISKRFHIRDGHGLVLLKKHGGIPLAIISGRSDPATAHRAKDLGFAHVVQGVHHKLQAGTELAASLSIPLDDVCFMGDDIIDVPLMEKVGLSAAPANSCPEALEAAAFVSAFDGGQGAVRELCELLMKSRGLWTVAIDAMRG